MKTKPTLLKKIIIVVGIILGIFVVLNIGMVIGARQASYMNQHGAIGQITKIDQDSIFIKDPDGIEKLIVVGTSTEIKNKDKMSSVSDLHADEFIIAIGSPDNACQLEAKAIQIVPPPPFYKSSK
ncbi:MAG: hypothetical protein P4L61_00140 [Candidatus Pacebacteria bacterium]|nr:hypothetical protein [Candidatus Paceibacterota bacterium]